MVHARPPLETVPLIVWVRGHTTALLSYGDALHVSRACSCIGTHAAIRAYHDVQELEIHRFLKRMYNHPEQLAIHICR